MRFRLILLAFFAAFPVFDASFSLAACGDPDAIGVSRTMTVDTTGGLEVGGIQYRGRLALGDMEVVLTFDDGPLPGTTERVLDTLRDACTRATFFMVGRMARATPALVRRAAAEGHTVATHTNRHPDLFGQMAYADASREIDRGIAAVTAALGRPSAAFFRFPGLAHTHALRRKLAAAHIGVFSADVMGYDWTGIGGDAIRAKVMRGLRLHHGGIVLLHDTKHATARMLGQLLKEMKAAGFRVVHIVPARQATPVAALPVERGGRDSALPVIPAKAGTR